MTASEADLQPISPLIAAGSRWTVGTGHPQTAEPLSPLAQRAFLLRGAEPIRAMQSDRPGTPKQTTHYDGQEDKESEDFNYGDFNYGDFAP